MFENICEIFMVLPFPQVQDVLFRLLQLQIPVHSLAQSTRLLEPKIFDDVIVNKISESEEP